MTQQTINRGSAPGDGPGETLYDAFGKVNDNFTELYTAMNNESSAINRTVDSDKHNWNITNDANPNFWGMLVTSSGAVITGLEAPTEGYKVIRAYVLINPMVLAHQDTGSLSSNRIVTPTQRDLVIGPNGTFTLAYSSASSKWVVLEYDTGVGHFPGFMSPILSTNSFLFVAHLSTRLGIPDVADARSLRISSTSDCWLRFGDGTVEVDSTNGIWFPRGREILGIPDGATNIAARGYDMGGRLNITAYLRNYPVTLHDNRSDIALTDVSTRIVLPSSARGIYRISATQSCFIQFGGNQTTVDEDTGMLFEQGTEVMEKGLGAGYIAAITYSSAPAGGSLYVQGVQ